ncbi:hypothetical protein GEV33_015505 [Tenebrio molitor]|uniref:Uncharacterized protein n=1 Tax=Tenebrio molitor TaxID=7067 RepID=A0A8J6H3Z7_TENMO|nr:hypothetical protein GEV33_015511 [Tenebrio molitor]KAH0807286.1 hypothetical protein GEV33_015505 [Tenebrio molitor]
MVLTAVLKDIHPVRGTVSMVFLKDIHQVPMEYFQDLPVKRSGKPPVPGNGFDGCPDGYPPGADGVVPVPGNGLDGSPGYPLPVGVVPGKPPDPGNGFDGCPDGYPPGADGVVPVPGNGFDPGYPVPVGVLTESLQENLQSRGTVSTVDLPVWEQWDQFQENLQVQELEFPDWEIQLDYQKVFPDGRNYTPAVSKVKVTSVIKVTQVGNTYQNVPK